MASAAAVNHLLMSPDVETGTNQQTDPTVRHLSGEVAVQVSAI